MSGQPSERVARPIFSIGKMSRRRLLVGTAAGAAAALVAGCRAASPSPAGMRPGSAAAKPSSAAAPTGAQTSGSVRHALVLGGGGPTGEAWEIGMIKGLKDAGIDPTQADLMVGTSAGSIVTTLIRSGRDIGSLYADQLAPVSAPAPVPAPASATGSGVSPDYLAQIHQMEANAPELTPALRIEIGKLALAATKVTSEDARVRQVVQSLGNPQDWPSQPLRIAAGDVADGTIRFFDKSQGVPIERAVAASSAIPGATAPITVGDRRYMDGSVGGINIDGAAGASIVLVLSPSTTVNPEDTRRQIDRARSQGSQVLNVSPDTDARAAMGPNNFDQTRLAPTAQAAARQAGTIADQVRSFWEGKA